MSSTFKTYAVIPATVLAALALAGCDGGADEGSGTDTETAAAGDTATDTADAPAKKLFANDFKGVCSGATVSGATAYDPEAESHKAVMFETWKNDDFIDRSSSALPDDWTVQFSADDDVYRQVDLVVCAKRSAAQKVKTCDGYKSDGKETRNKVNWHTATYDVTLVEATTGKTVAETTIEANDDSCPMFQSFEGTSDTVDGYARPTEPAITEFVKPHMAK